MQRAYKARINFAKGKIKLPSMQGHTIEYPPQNPLKVFQFIMSNCGD